MPHCTSCSDFRAPHHFPRPPQGSLCDHPTTVCSECWEEWLSYELDAVRADHINCVECSNRLTPEDVKLRATSEIYERYMRLLELANRPPPAGTYRRCLSSACDSGQTQPDEHTIFECEACSHKHCVPCQIPVHEGVECEAPELERKRAGIRFEVSWKGRRYRMREAHKDEEDATGEFRRKNCKECPGVDCGIMIQKDGGCEMMECYDCGHSFCWLCLAAYEEVEMHGNSGHKKECPLWREEGVHGPQHVEGINNAEDALALIEIDEYEPVGRRRIAYHRGPEIWNPDPEAYLVPQNGQGVDPAEDDLIPYNDDAYGERNEAGDAWRPPVHEANPWARPLPRRPHTEVQRNADRWAALVDPELLAAEVPQQPLPRAPSPPAYLREGAYPPRFLNAVATQALLDAQNRITEPPAQVPQAAEMGAARMPATTEAFYGPLEAHHFQRRAASEYTGHFYMYDHQADVLGNDLHGRTSDHSPAPPLPRTSSPPAYLREGAYPTGMGVSAIYNALLGEPNRATGFGATQDPQVWNEFARNGGRADVVGNQVEVADAERGPLLDFDPHWPTPENGL